MTIRKNVFIDCHVELDVDITPEPTDADMERIKDHLDEEMLESVYAARQATKAVTRTVKIEEFSVTIVSEFEYDEGFDEGALDWVDVDDDNKAPDTPTNTE